MNETTNNEIPQAPTPKNSSLPKWLGTLILVAVVFGVGYIAGQGKVNLVDGKLEVNRAYDNQRADYSLFWDAYDTLNSKYVDRPLDQQKLLHGAISGMVAATGDPYTVFFDPEAARQFAQELQGTFDGIGAEVGLKNEQIVVISPLDDSPAQRAGLLPGDAIIAINDESTSGMSVDAAVSKIRGQAGTNVKLTVVHEGKNTAQDITITRARIEIKSVKLEYKEIDGKKIAVIKLTRFNEDTKGLFDQAVDNILQSGAKGVILDMRNNPGGYLETAVTTSSNWVESGNVVLRERSYNGSVKEYKAESWPRLKGLKTVVLVNGGSASAAEIVAGALQDHGAATLVGEKTYGKGSVQELSELKDDSTLKITTAKWFTPNDRSIDHNGLDPDVIVDRTPEDVQANRDPQMDKALELMK